MEDPIANVTIATNRAQRQNLGRTRIRGFQTDVEYRFLRDWRAGAAYVLNRARITENTDTTLVGKFLQQVPKNRGSLSLSYSNPRYVSVSVNAIFVGHQFDDDQNTKARPSNGVVGLPAYGVLDLSVMRAIGRNVDVFLNGQNLLDKEYYVQLLPTTNAAPRLVSAGVRVRFSQR